MKRNSYGNMKSEMQSSLFFEDFIEDEQLCMLYLNISCFLMILFDLFIAKVDLMRHRICQVLAKMLPIPID